MNYWLLKSEPSTYSWQDLLEAGQDMWDGVRNYQAANNLKKMAKGDQAFFYHSVKQKRIVGIVSIIKEYYPDPTDSSGKFVAVDVSPVIAFPKPVTLAQIKAEESLQNMVLVRQSRLSVSPVTSKEWNIICKMGGV